MDASTKFLPLFLPLLGRLLLASIFVQAGIRKLGAIGATAATMSNHGIPASDILVWGVVALELGGGLMLATGLLARLVALALCLYTLALALIFHDFWNATGAAFGTERSFFFGHLEIMGGMLYVTAFGAGAYSLDALIWPRRTTLAPAE
jgi:putative oxidoreductase